MGDNGKLETCGHRKGPGSTQQVTKHNKKTWTGEKNLEEVGGKRDCGEMQRGSEVTIITIHCIFIWMYIFNFQEQT